MRNLGLSLLYCVLFLGASYVAVKFILGFIWPFVLALVFAAAIEPAVKRMQRKGVPRGLAVLASLGVFVTLLVFVVTFLLSKFLGELGQLYEALPGIYSALVVFAMRVTGALKEALEGLPFEVDQYLTFPVEPLYDAIKSVLMGLLRGAGSLPTSFLGFIVSLLATFFISKDREALGRFAGNLAPSEARKQIVAANREVISTFLAIIRAQMLLAGVTAVLSSLGLWVFGFGSPLVLGVVCGLLDLLPLFGPSLVYLSMIFWGIGSGDAGLALRAGIVFAIVAGVRQVLEPRVIGKAAGMHPLASLFSIYVGVMLLGPMGFVVGPLAAVVLRALIRAGVLPAFNGGRDW